MAENTPPPGDDEPAFDERGISQVAGPANRNNTLGIIMLGVIVCVLLFFVWSSGDREPTPQVTAAVDEEFDSPSRVDTPVVPEPDLDVQGPNQPSAGPISDPYTDELRRLALQEAEDQRELAEQRRRSPILIVNNSGARGAGTQGLTAGTLDSLQAQLAAAGDAAGLAGDATVSQEEQFANRVGSTQVPTVEADFIASRSQMIAQGTTIRGVLETAIQSDLPGFVRAEVSHDVYSFDGSRLLIPKASRLVGQYKSGLVRGQTRLFVIWTRVLRPDGASILIGSPGTDLLGRAGVEGDLDTHFFKIFGSSVLLSLIDGAIDVAVERARRSGGDSNTTILQDSSSLHRAAEIALENSINIPPTIHVDQGTAIQVFVAKDLDFRNVELR